MNKFVIALMAVMMMMIAGCASKPAPAPVIGTGTPIDLGDFSDLEEVDATDDEAVEDLSDMVAAEM